MFVRETEGVYTFGKRRVFIKIDAGNKIKVRIGGGYIAIDDFIKQYTKPEVDKIKKKNKAAE